MAWLREELDPRSVVTVAESVVGPLAPQICELWRTKQFQYAFLRAAAAMGVVREQLAPTPDGTGPTLAELEAFVATCNS